VIEADWFIWSANGSYSSLENAIASQGRRHSIGHYNIVSHRCLCLSLAGRRVFQVPSGGERAASNLNRSRWPRRGLGSFFIYVAEQRERKIERQQEEEKIPVLEYGGIFYTHDEKIKTVESTYFLRVKMSKGEGMAEHCVAFLTVDGTDISYSPCVWADNSRVCDIARDLHMDIRLFTLVKEKLTTYSSQESLIFASASTDMSYSKTGMPYTVKERSYVEYSEKRLKVKSYVTQGITPICKMSVILLP
jgi:hypothetical protein